MIDHRLQRRVALGFVGAMLLMASLNFLSWRNKQAAANEADSMTQTYAVMTELERTLGDVVEMETGARGFAATGQEQFLDPLNSTQSSLGKDLNSLRQLTASEPNQITWIAPLTRDINKSVSAATEIVALRRQSKLVPLGAMFQQGKQGVDVVRNEIRAEEFEQSHILTQRTHGRSAKGKRSSAVMIVSTLVELSLLALAWSAVSRALLASVRAQAKNEDLNAELEHRVAERTGQLFLKTLLLGQSTDALRAESRTLQSVLDNMEEGLTAADNAGRFTLWNRAARKILGMSPNDDVAIENWARTYGTYLPDRETLFPTERLPLVRAMRGESCDVEMFVRNSGCAGVWLEVSARPLKNEKGTIDGALATFRDISRKKHDEHQIRVLNEELEERVKQRTAQVEAANKELEAFTYSVSHDLRAPLRHIAGFSQILIEDFAAFVPPDGRQYLDRISRGATRMGLLIDKLLGLAGVGRQTLSLHRANLNSIVEDVITILSPECQGRLVEWKVKSLGSVDCDSVLLGQVFQNLIANALKFTRPCATAVIEIGRLANTEQPTFFVRDNGVGFDMKFADKLFGVFQRLHRVEEFEGTGIGLATVRRIIQKHAGRTWAESALEKGATFYFTVNLSVENAIEPRDRAATGVQS